MVKIAAVMAFGISVSCSAAFAYEDLPTCDGVAGGQDCQITLEDGALVFGYGPGDPSTLMISQADPRGAWIAKIAPFEVSPGPYGASLHDVTGDGQPEILQPVYFGNVNVSFRVLGRDSLGRFRPMGEVLSLAPEAFEHRDGLLLAPARANASTYVQTAWRTEDLRLVQVFDLATDLAAPEGMRCTLTRGPGWSPTAQSALSLIEACEAAAQDPTGPDQ